MSDQEVPGSDSSRVSNLLLGHPPILNEKLAAYHSYNSTLEKLSSAGHHASQAANPVQSTNQHQVAQNASAGGVGSHKQGAQKPEIPDELLNELYGYGHANPFEFSRDRTKSIETIGELSPDQTGDQHVPDVTNSKSI